MPRPCVPYHLLAGYHRASQSMAWCRLSWRLASGLVVCVLLVLLLSIGELGFVSETSTTGIIRSFTRAIPPPPPALLNRAATYSPPAPPYASQMWQEVSKLLVDRISGWAYRAPLAQELSDFWSGGDPDAGSCSTFARWLGQSEDEMCDKMALTDTTVKPRMELAVAAGWMRGFFRGEESKITTFDCPLATCKYTVARGAPVNSTFYDGYLQYLYSDGPPVAKTNETKPWFLTGFIMEEPESTYGLQADHFKNDNFDVALTYRLPDGMPREKHIMTSLMGIPFAFWSNYKPLPWLQRNYSIASMISKAHMVDRVNVFRDLAHHIHVDQFGAVDRSKEVSKDVPECQSGNWAVEQQCVASRYKFYLSFENSQFPGYVTEKMWNALFFGAIPIYWGSPTIDEVIPHRDAIIRVSDFNTTADLADYLRFLMASPTAYEKHWKWRERPLSDEFLEYAWNTAISRAPCRFCDYLTLEKEAYEQGKKEGDMQPPDDMSSATTKPARLLSRRTKDGGEEDGVGRRQVEAELRQIRSRSFSDRS